MQIPNLKGKTAVVTGASRGVGRSIAVALGRAGAHVVLVARNHPALEETAREIVADGGQATLFSADVTDPNAVDALKILCDVGNSLGTPQILVNAAGVFGPIHLIKDSDANKWLDTIRVNLFAPFLTCRAFVDGMISSGWGRIVNVTSAAALHPPGPLNSAYGTSKAALNQFTRHLAAELAGSGVTANVIHPGDVMTDMWADIRDKADALGPEGDAYRTWVNWVEETGGDPPGKAADLVLRIVGDESAVVSGQFLWIENGLQAPIPSWGDVTDARPWK
jgi:NAD(P)-dependent dehydrogenase (short-subunit alcohol dehydrogenase family)